MDFSKFRETGDLSDITVLVDEDEFKLHRFPLYAKSDYFRNLSMEKDSKDKRVKLEDFPGGAEMFSLVADFCYNMPVPLTKNNVVQIRCAASRLEMEGPGNLADMADKFLQDTITSAKLSRSIQSIVTLLLNCGKTGSLAEQTGIVSSCVDALIECWLKPPTKFSSFASKAESSDDKTTCGLCTLPVEWFVKILVKSQEEGVRMSELASLAVQYVTKAMEGETFQTSEEDADKDTENRQESSGSETREVVIAGILDAVLLALPEESYNLPYITPEWLTKVLKIATTHVCACRHILVKVAGEMLSTISAEDLCIISPAVIHDIVVQAAGDQNQSQQACKLVDTYTSEMAKRGVLTSETFKLLMSTAPANGRTDHNKVYDVLEYVLQAEKDKLNAHQIEELIGLINFSQLNEVTLQKAYDSDVVPKDQIAKGSLTLCHRLRAELDNMKYKAIVQCDSSRKPRDSIKGFADSREIVKTGADGGDAMKAATDVLIAARTKLVGPLYTSHRQYYSHPSGASHVPSANQFNSSLDDDTSFEDDLDYRYDRSYRSLDSRSRPKSYAYTNQSMYFPYSSRY